MRRNRSAVAAVFASSALLLLPVAIQAKPRAIQQPRNGQRVVNNAVIQLQIQKLRQQRKKYHTISGTVASIHHNKQVPGTGTIKLVVHRHHRKNNQPNAARANGAVAANKGKCQRRAAALGQQRKRQSHTVKVHYGRGTKVAVTVKGLFDHLKTRTVGSGKNKAKVVVNQPRIETRNLPSHVRHVKKGQHVRVVLHEPHQNHNAKAVHIVHPSAMPKSK
jgi:hypothetical protein